VAAPPAAKLLAAQKLAKRRPTLSRLLTQVPGAEPLTAGRAKTRWRSNICPAISALFTSTPALSLDGVKSETETKILNLPVSSTLTGPHCKTAEQAVASRGYRRKMSERSEFFLR
jgi:hypothetical protein